MNTREVEQLIEKFYEGETTLAEERILREYFGRDQIPDELAEHKPLFAFQQKERDAEIPDPLFDRALFPKISEDEPGVVTLVTKRSRTVYIASLAAAVILLAGIAVTFVLNLNADKQFSSQDKLAYAQAHEALMIVSSNMNCGVSQVRYLQAFDKGVEKAKMISKFFEYQTLIINPDEAQSSPDKTTR